MNPYYMAELLPKPLLGKKIRQVRKRLGLSQTGLAEALGAPGMQSDVGKWERGTKRPSYATVRKIAELGGEPLQAFESGGDTLTEDRRAKLLAAEYLNRLAEQLRAEATLGRKAEPPKPQTEVVDIMAYRRRKGRDSWHWCRNCRNWPTSDYDEQSSKPSSGELCNECKAKAANNECNR